MENWKHIKENTASFFYYEDIDSWRSQVQNKMQESLMIIQLQDFSTFARNVQERKWTLARDSGLTIARQVVSHLLALIGRSIFLWFPATLWMGALSLKARAGSLAAALKKYLVQNLGSSHARHFGASGGHSAEKDTTPSNPHNISQPPASSLQPPASSLQTPSHSSDSGANRDRQIRSSNQTGGGDSRHLISFSDDSGARAVSVNSEDLYKAFCGAIYAQNFDALEQLHKTYGQDTGLMKGAKSSKQFASSLLYEACAHSKGTQGLLIVQYLIENVQCPLNAEVLRKKTKTQSTKSGKSLVIDNTACPLHAAIQTDDLELVRYMIDRGAEVYQSDVDYYSVQHPSGGLLTDLLRKSSNKAKK